MVAVVAEAIVPLNAPLNVVAVTVPVLVISLAPIFKAPDIIPPANANFSASNSAIALSTLVADIFPVADEVTSAAV